MIILLNGYSKINNTLNYISGYGKHANHLAIALIGLEIFDIYTDIAFLIDLKIEWKNSMCFDIFLTSMILGIIYNCICVIWMFKHETQTNALFVNWFYEHSSIICILMFFFTITGDFSMITTVFSSQIFGHAIFYSPIKLNIVNLSRISTVLSVLIEHVSQLGVQIYILFEGKEDVNTVVIAALCVSVIDVLYALIKVVFWVVIHKSVKK